MKSINEVVDGLSEWKLKEFAGRYLENQIDCTINTLCELKDTVTDRKKYGSIFSEEELKVSNSILEKELGRFVKIRNELRELNFYDERLDQYLELTLKGELNEVELKELK